MPEYQLQIKQVVDYPRCRIYREFIHKLINDRSIRINGGSGLFHFTVLCSYANFRTSYRRIDGISYTVSPGEWVCTVKELSCWFRTRFHRQALSMLDTLQKQHLISYTLLGRGNVVKYKILHWARHNSALEYNAPCQKDTGFFFLPVSVALELVSSARCSEMDIVLDLWVYAYITPLEVIPMKTRAEIYGNEAAALLRIVTMYPGLNMQQLLCFHPDKEEIIKTLLSHLQKQGRIFQTDTGGYFPSGWAAKSDNSLIRAAWVLLDFIGQVEYHAPGDFPAKLIFFANGELYEIVYAASGQEALINHALRDDRSGGRRIILVDNPEDIRRIDCPGISGFCTVDAAGQVHYFKKTGGT